jgi:hypothetical protein
MESMTGDEALHIAAQQIHECFLCGSARLHRIGCYVPKNPLILDVAMPQPGPDQARTYWYGICRRCFKRGQQWFADRAEAKIVAMGEAQRN